LKLALELNKTIVGGDKASRQNPRDVKQGNWVAPEQRRVGDMKL
jgi:hypothetical protein